jgi:hypothetical protein
MPIRVIGWGMLLAVAVWGTPTLGQERAFQFALMGDLPYSKLEEKEFVNLISMLNASELAFVVHVGDMQIDARAYMRDPSNATPPCNDVYDGWFLDMIGRIRHPGRGHTRR